MTYPRGRKGTTTKTATEPIAELKIINGILYSYDAEGNRTTVGKVSTTSVNKTVIQQGGGGSPAYAIALGDL